MSIDHGCSACSCPGYDVVYYLCISVSLSELAGEIDCTLWGERDYGLSTTTTTHWSLGRWSVFCEVQMDSLWFCGAFYGVLHRLYRLDLDWYGFLHTAIQGDVEDGILHFNLL